MGKIYSAYLLATLLLFSLSCTQPMDPIVEAVNETKSTLQNKTWQLTDYVITVKNPDIPPPLLIPFNDSLIEAGNYHLSDMLPGDTDFTEYFFQFLDDNTILTDTIRDGSFVGLGGRYFVWNDIKVRLHAKRFTRLNYEYYYLSTNKTMTFTLTEEDASKAIEAVTDRLINAGVKEIPEQIGKAISDAIHDSPVIKQKIKDWLKEALAGKLPGVFDHDYVHSSEALAEHVRIHVLDSINWKQVLKNAIKDELGKIGDLDPTTLAPSMTEEIAASIASELTTDELLNVLTPYMDGLEHQDPESMADHIATLIVEILYRIFDEENLEKLIEPAWESFTQMSEAQIDSIALKFTEIVQEHWLNVDTLTKVFLPITEKIDDTPITQMGALAQEVTDSLEVLVNKLNNRFPGLGLDPDYESIQAKIKAILIAAKPVISTQGPEKVAQEIASLIIDEFLNTENIESAFVKVLEYLQSIDAATAAETIAQWLVNIEERIEPELIQWLADKLGPILDNQNPELTSRTIATKVQEYTNQHFNKGNISELVLRELNETLEINGRGVAKLIAHMIIDHGLAKEGIDLEQLAEVIRPELDDNGGGSIGDKIKDAMANNDMIRSGQSPDIIAQIITFLIYRKLWNDTKIANNFKEATIIISHE